MQLQGRSLRKRVEGEFEESAGLNKLIETLLGSFLKSESSYGIITDIKTDIDNVFSFVKDIISKKGLDIYALKIRDEIYLSKAVRHFDELYNVIRGRALLIAKKGLIEIWDDHESKILHFLVPSLRKHFPIEYENEYERKEIVEALIEKSV